jgi:hypothetical protein
VPVRPGFVISPVRISRQEIICRIYDSILSTLAIYFQVRAKDRASHILSSKKVDGMTCEKQVGFPEQALKS